MSRSGYNDDCDQNWDWIMWRGAVKAALRGRRGQAFLKEMLAAMDAMPDKQLIAYDLENNGAVCAIGSVGKARGLDMSKLDPENYHGVADAFGISRAMAQEIVFENDEATAYNETPEQRFKRMHAWIESEIRQDSKP